MNNKSVDKKQKKRIDEASKNLEKSLKIIGPFTKPRKIGAVSTEGKWQSPSAAIGISITQTNSH